MTRADLEFGLTRIENASLDDVRSAMMSTKFEDGPPELQLLYGAQVENQPQLWLMCLFSKQGLEPEWCVRFVRSKAKSSQYLAAEMPKGDQFVARELCGCIESLRRECVLTDETLVIQASEWFLNHGTPMPSLVWLDSNATFLDN